jgi:type IV fimbrial biogenesis protein FimT
MIQTQKGFTIIELMIAIAILAIISAAAVPTMNALLSSKNIHAVGKIFSQSIRLARAEAVQRGSAVQVSPSTPGLNWASGWKIEQVDAANNVTLIREFSALSGNPTFVSDTFSDVNPLIVLPNGQVEQMGTFTLSFANCASPDKITFQLMISGLLRKTTTQC